MRTIIAGTRVDNLSIEFIDKIVKESALSPSVVLCGMAKGADVEGARWPKQHNIPVEYFPANWDKDGKAAGMFRNIRMANNAEALIAIWDGKSKGTKQMINVATKRNLTVYVHML